MRKLIVPALIICAMLLSSCSVRKVDGDETLIAEESTFEQTEAVTKVETGSTATETEALEEVLPIGIYNMTYCDFGTREVYELQEDFQDDGTLGRDLCVFAIFPSREQELSGQYFKYIWEDAVAANPDSAEMKVGYFFEYTTPEGNYAKTILRPADITEEYWDFIEVYIYDDVNQDVNAWHSHLLEEQMTDETLITSFKITAGARIAEVSDIRLTAFLYSPDRADEIDANYIERHGYTVNVDWYPGRAK